MQTDRQTDRGRSALCNPAKKTTVHNATVRPSVRPTVCPSVWCPDGLIKTTRGHEYSIQMCCGVSKCLAYSNNVNSGGPGFWKGADYGSRDQSLSEIYRGGAPASWVMERSPIKPASGGRAQEAKQLNCLYDSQSCPCIFLGFIHFGYGGPNVPRQRGRRPVLPKASHHGHNFVGGVSALKTQDRQIPDLLHVIEWRNKNIVS